MISKYQYKNVTWIDLNSPSKEELQIVTEQCQIPGTVLDELATNTLRSKVELYPNFIYLILHFPPKIQAGKMIDQEIDFLIGKNFLVTAHYETIDIIEQFASRFESNTEYGKQHMGEHAGFVFYYLIKELYHKANLDLDSVHERLREIEQGIFNKQERETVQTISRINRVLLDFRQALKFHKEILVSLEHAGKDFFGEDFDYYLSAITNEYNKIESMLDNYRETLNDMRETNDSLLASKTSRTIQNLTVLNSILLPLTFITGVFGMNMAFVFIQDTKDFLVTLGGMVLVAFAFFLLFKTKQWL
jgi:magnesium transporter